MGRRILFTVGLCWIHVILGRRSESKCSNSFRLILGASLSLGIHRVVEVDAVRQRFEILVIIDLSLNLGGQTRS